MEKSKINTGNRLYHALFGWCKVVSRVSENKVLVDLEADSITYYLHGKGYKKITRKENNTNVIRTPIEDLFADENISRDMQIKKLAFKPEITINSNKTIDAYSKTATTPCNCDNDECESNLIIGRNCKNCINKL